MQLVEAVLFESSYVIMVSS